MILKLTPQYKPTSAAVVSVLGETLTIGDDVLDLAPLPEGATIPFGAVASEWIAGDIKRIKGELHVPLVLALSDTSSLEACFPVPITVIQDGPVEMPV